MKVMINLPTPGMAMPIAIPLLDVDELFLCKHSIISFQVLQLDRICTCTCRVNCFPFFIYKIYNYFEQINEQALLYIIGDKLLCLVNRLM